MDAFIKKLCDKYKVLESDVQTLLGCMEEVHFKKRDLIVREGTKNSNLYFKNREQSQRKAKFSLKISRSAS